MCRCFCFAVVGRIVQWVGWLVCVRFIGIVFFVCWSMLLGAGQFLICQVVGSLIVFVDVFDFVGVLILVRD